ncbi:D-alanyl-D-alanine carboxypeptidase (penicillin-binding protein 5/6) [Advenella incenata]|jgi:D-alanyl-D-alanine carboxypeptidase (penicillin-binding protein 5/6)|uniref:serine-type D-Ala-D-Ala carboxypeptidase n=1 Tax=Advenella incenata TaxID=267800 RepID=A0A4V2FTR0_9BURK|nr:D-alanyl-D-alanine carboxypeptidase family protein [Advenella incenata]RZT99095.1 D-alanyl-D-alanine carboxypeptidase (penicillin-binding protein 5/6) [Advenella incenata]
MFLRRIVLILIIVLVAGGAYVFFNKTNNSAPSGSTQTATGSDTTQTGSAAQPAPTTPPKPESRSSVPVTNASTPVLTEVAGMTPPQTNVKAWFLIDATSGQIIGNQEPDLKVSPASLTKLMTASLVFSALDENRIRPEQEVTVSEKAWRTGGSRMFIRVNTQVTVDDLIKGMIVQSGNDATIQLAEVVAGSEDVFVNQMNKEAALFGMNNTHFTDPTGLPAPEHYTTVRDLSVLAQHVIKDHPKYYHYFSQPEFTYNKIRQHNRNGLLSRNIGVDGLKTGHTEDAGYCLIAAAKRDDRRLISVVVGAATVREREQVSQNLLDWGYQNFTAKQVAAADAPLISPRVWEGTVKEAKLGAVDGVSVTVPRGMEDKVQTITQINGKLVAPLAKGQTVGNVQFVLNGKVLKQESLTVLEDVPQAGFFGRMWDKVLSSFNS